MHVLFVSWARGAVQYHSYFYYYCIIIIVIMYCIIAFPTYLQILLKGRLRQRLSFVNWGLRVLISREYQFILLDYLTIKCLYLP